MRSDASINGGKACMHDCLLAQAAAGLSVGLVLVGPAGRIGWLNAAAEGLLGVAGGAARGKAFEQVLRDPQLTALWLDARGVGENVQTSISLTWPRELELNVTISPCRDSQARDLGHALLLVDVTRDRRVQVELSHAVATRLLKLTSGHMPPEPVANLTQQELRVLRLVGRGLSNEDIAEETNISSSTVRSHLKSVYRKLNLNSRTEAIAFAVRHHLA